MARAGTERVSINLSGRQFHDPALLETVDRALRESGLPAARLFVAGGLVPDRVAQVVRALRPFAVDVASGVEQEPGIKDHGKIEDFIRRAKAA